MKKLFLIINLGVLIMTAQATFAQQKWTNYANARYGYSISYPSDLLAAQGEADNGDGQIFSGASAELRVFGSQMLLGKTMRGEFDRLVRENPVITYKLLRGNFFVVSGKKDDRIFYRKTMAKRDGSFITFNLEYDATQRDIYDKIVPRIVKSFK